MPIFNLFPASERQSVSISDPDVLNFLNPSKSEYISATDALKNSDLFTIISLLSGDLASAKINADTKRAQAMIDNPTSTSNAHAFWQSMNAQLLLDGNAYAYRWRNVNGVDLRWEYLRPSQVQAYLLDDGSGLVYDIDFDEPDVGTMTAVPQSDMIHMRLMSMNGGMVGLSPLTALVDEFNIKKRSNGLALSALNQAVTNPGVLSVQHGGLVNEKEKMAIGHSFARQLADPKNPVVVDQLTEWKPLEIKSDIAKILAQTDWTGNQLAKIYGVPNNYLNGQGDQQSNLDQSRSMYEHTLKRYGEPILSEFNNKLNANFTLDLRPATDATGEAFANTIANLTRYGAIAGNQATYILSNSGFLPEGMPKADKPEAPTLKGGDTDEDD